MEKKGTYRVDREFCEKLVTLFNHSTAPVMDIFRADREIKMRVVIDYDPQSDKIEVNYFEEERH